MADPDCTYAVVDMSKKKKNREHAEKNCLDTEATYYNMALYSTVNYDTEDQDLPTTTSIAAEEDYSRLRTYLRNSPTAKEPEPVIVSTTSSDRKSGSKSGHKASECQKQVVRPARCAVAIVLVLAVLAIIVLFVCIAALFVEIKKLQSTQESISAVQQPQSNDLVSQSILHSSISSIEKKLSSQVIENEATFNESLSTVERRLTQELQASIAQVFQLMNESLEVILNQLMEQQVSLNNSREKNNLFQLELQEKITDQELAMFENNITEKLLLQRSVQQDAFHMLQDYIEEQSFPASSCIALPQSFSSGYYWVRASNGSAVRVYCDMTRSCGNITGGWMRVVELDMTNSSHQCPSGLMERAIPAGQTEPRTCVSTNTRPSCTNGTLFDTIIANYTRVCGKIIGYQIGGTNGFHTNAMQVGIDSSYVDGISLTHGSSRQHIWTFASARDQESASQCPGEEAPPDFVGRNHFCDAGATTENSVTNERFFLHHPLWDCENGVMSCDSSGSPPWFYKQLPQPTTDNIEMRVCRDEPAHFEDMAIEIIEIYVQ